MTSRGRRRSDWLLSRHLPIRDVAQRVEFWTLAAQADFELEGLDGRRILEQPASSDTRDIHVCRLVAFVFEQRAHDKAGAAHALALLPPGESTHLFVNLSVLRFLL